MRPVRLLHVEDNASDAEIFADALELLGSNVEPSVATDGVAAMALLRNGCRNGTVPDLVVLDLNLPHKTGRDVLSEIQADAALREGLRATRFVILTTSAAPSEVAACYGLGASAFLTKPLGLTAFRRLVAAIDGFWMRSVVFPD